MKSEQARKLVTETFPAPFEKDRFLYFVKNVVNKLDDSEDRKFSRTKQYIKNAFNDHVSKFERLGTYTDPDGAKLDVLVVHLTAETKLERARTAIRNFVADHLKQRDNKDAALVAFVSPTEKQWRFSYIKMDYQAVETSTGRVGIETKLTPARRFSYIVGEGESCHTAQARFLPLLQDTATNPTLAQIEEAFSVEAVTKEFFKLYRGLFEGINAALEKLATKDKAVAKEFKEKGIKTVDFAKKLMGQIVFLYFLQKKGWLGVEKGKAWGTGPHDFLRRLAQGKYRKFDNFFNDVLEPLFYDTLATDRGHEAWCDIFKCRIPFLNGGLFEALGGYDWRNVDIELPNKLFFNDEQVEHGVTGTGVLDVFDRYNFTVNEAEPLEKEVAIDPEMLGKVFENLIEENRRKGQGAYYTPREIVHYMCQQSLINYLDTALNGKTETMVPETPKQNKLFGDAKPKQKAIQAPGGGELVPRADIETFIYLGEQISHYEAVPTEYQVKMPKSVRDNAKEIDAKLAQITICDPAVGSGAFPVGMMSEIVRMRSALTPYFTVEDVRRPYYFKRHAIQSSLYGVDIDPGAVEIAKLRLWLSLVVDEDEAEVIKPLPNLDFKIVVGNSLLGFPYKSERLDKVEKLKDQYFKETDHDKKAALKAEIDETIAKCFESSKRSLGYHVDFDFEVNFSEVFRRHTGFDILIANPPYVSHDRITEGKDHLKRLFKAYNPFADIYCYFFERAANVLHKRGCLTFITSNSFIKAAYGEPLRRLLGMNTCIRQLLNIEQSQVFDQAIVNVAVLVATRGRHDNGNTLATNSAWNEGAFSAYVASNGFTLPSSVFTDPSWTLAPAQVLAVRDSMLKAGTRLKDLRAKIRLGVATGYNDAFLVSAQQREAFIAADEASSRVLVPVVRGRDIERYAQVVPTTYLIAAKNGVNIKRDYPVLFDHLDSFGKEFKQRGAQGQDWWNLRACSFYNDFEVEKIVWIELSNTARFTICPPGVWCLNSAYFMLPPSGLSARYVLGFLNSRAIDFYFRLMAQTSGMGVTRWINLYVEQFPIPKLPPTKQRTVETLVEQILDANERSDERRREQLEHEIDAVVYDHYGLTNDQVALIERAAS